jgi:organic hydroperoxide reductase OsmC/OhrA
MPHKIHRYEGKVVWTGNLGQGTASYTAYLRNHEIGGPDKQHRILGSSDPAFRGDPARYNPEELLVNALSTCHMLWVLHLCAEAGVRVLTYEDVPWGTMVETADGGGRFAQVLLRPRMLVAPGDDLQKAELAHDRAHELCFLARSMAFPVDYKPEILTAAAAG